MFIGVLSILQILDYLGNLRTIQKELSFEEHSLHRVCMPVLSNCPPSGQDMLPSPLQ
jgi:hypothetical protein